MDALHVVTVKRRLVLLVALLTSPLAAGQLQPAASDAFDTYATRARDAFVTRARGTVADAMLAELRPGRELAARPAAEDGIIGVPEGLIHHWVGAVLVRGVDLDRVLALSRAYDQYPKFYKGVIAATLVARDDDDAFRVLVRIREGAAGITAVLDVHSRVQYVFPSPGRAYAISLASEIREVQNAGQPTERLLPPGMDRGYLWRAAAFTSFVERDGGVAVVMETIGLSRRFPPMLGWVIEPIARRLGRRSVETSLEEFRSALQARR